MGRITTTTAASFIPEIWADEIKAQYENMLVFGKKVKQINHRGKAGDIIHIPDVSNLGAANDMSETGEVVRTSVTESETQVTLNKWKEKSISINDLAKVQSKYDIRAEYTKKISYALNLAIEQDIAALFASSDFTGYNGDGTTEASAGAAITLKGILTAQQYMLSKDVPTTDTCMIVPPSQRTEILQIAAFTSSDYVNGKAMETGLIGQILGMDVYVSNNCPLYTVSTSKINAIILQRDAAVLALQIAPRVQTQYELKYLSNLVVADVVYGVKALRTDNAVRLRTNGTT